MDIMEKSVGVIDISGWVGIPLISAVCEINLACSFEY